MDFILETTSYNILQSGSLVVPGNQDVTFHLDNLIFRFSFHKEESKDKNQGRFEVKIVEDETLGRVLELRLYNMDTSLFGGPTKIVQVGRYHGYALYLQFSLVTLNSNDNQVQQLLFYTFYQDKTKKD